MSPGPPRVQGALLIPRSSSRTSDYFPFFSGGERRHTFCPVGDPVDTFLLPFLQFLLFRYHSCTFCLWGRGFRRFLLLRFGSPCLTSILVYYTYRLLSSATCSFACFLSLFGHNLCSSLLFLSHHPPLHPDLSIFLFLLFVHAVPGRLSQTRPPPYPSREGSTSMRLLPLI